ncbi:membrane protein [Streptomyces camponoticapitis]|uniref:Membrane protein n=1 Tax=Streptomyces camponoticapitis TaxID=1616125 RepID=A0ABQ2ELA3_9ACTN|nr:membrane protein [Streptomyces camponoticapitis]
MTPAVAAAVLLAAVTHATWNAIAHTIRDQLVAFTLIAGGGAVLGAVAVCLAPFPAAGAWPYLIASAVLHVGYQALLMRSFSLGDFGQMYPIARGTAPLLVTVLAAVFVSESLDRWQATGVAVASAGLVGVALWGMRSAETKPQWPALLAALATGVSIAAYTVVDGVGVRESGTPLGYIGWLMILQGSLIPLYALHTRRGTLFARLRPHVRLGLLGAFLSVGAYALVLWAQTRAALAPIAALRESSLMPCSYRICHEPI